MKSLLPLSAHWLSRGGLRGVSASRMLLSSDAAAAKPSERDSSKSSKEKAQRPASTNRPFSLPPGKFRPKQSLGQNFLSDQNYVNKIVEAMPPDQSAQGHR